MLRYFHTVGSHATTPTVKRSAIATMKPATNPALIMTKDGGAKTNKAALIDPKQSAMKSDAFIVEEQESRQGGASTDEIAKRRELITARMRAAKKARAIELCFLVEASDAMEQHINALREKIREIANKFTCIPSAHSCPAYWYNHSLKKPRFAVVAYRRLCDECPCDVLRHTDSDEEFRLFCTTGIKRVSNFNTASPAVSKGLEQAALLDWTPASTKVLFHLAAEPCRETSGSLTYHAIAENFGCEDQSGGALRMRYVQEWLKGRKEEIELQPSAKAALASLHAKGVHYCFGAVTDRADSMVELLTKAYGREIPSFPLKNPWHIYRNVVSRTSLAIDYAISTWQSSLSPRMKTMATEWAHSTEINGLAWSYEAPLDRRTPKRSQLERWRSLYCQIYDNIRHRSLLKITQKARQVEIACYKEPIALGSKYIVYLGRNTISSTELVLKKYRCEEELGDPHSCRAFYESIAQKQTEAAFLARKFTEKLKEIGRRSEIVFPTSYVLSTRGEGAQRDEYLLYERKCANGSVFMRFSNCLGMPASEETLELNNVFWMHREKLEAFSHFTYNVSNGYLLVTDLQGTVTSDRDTGHSYIELTDPTIHCLDLARFGHNNLGMKVMRCFFADHLCSEYCMRQTEVEPCLIKWEKVLW